MGLPLLVLYGPEAESPAWVHGDNAATVTVRVGRAGRAVTLANRAQERTRVTRALAPKEHAEQVFLFSWSEIATRRYPELQDLFAIPNAGGYSGGFKRNMLRVIAMKREGMKPGVPDICLPHAHGKWNALYIEMKRRNATPSDTKPEQRDWHRRLELARNRVIVARGWEEARDGIVDYLSLAAG